MKVLKFGAVVFLDKNSEEFLILQGEPSKDELVKTILENKDK